MPFFACLRTLKPVVHRVDNTEPPAPCKLCGQTHGYADRNFSFDVKIRVVGLRGYFAVFPAMRLTTSNITGSPR